jgi:Alpha-(1->3)-arabinofuranosyltransferase
MKFIKMLGKFLKRPWVPPLIYAALSLCVLGTLLRPGYVLTLDILDIVFSSHAKFTIQIWGLQGLWDWISAAAPFNLLIHYLSIFIPAWLLQKLVLFTILTMAGWGAHRLVSSHGIAAYYAGIIYMINPFTYVRFLEGQWQILWAYAFFPFAILAFMALLKQGGRRNIIKVVLLSTIVGLFHIAGFFLLFFTFFIIFAVMTIIDHKEPGLFIENIKNIAVSAGGFILLNLYWLIPVITSNNMIVNQLSRADMLDFAPKAISRFGVMFDVASMYGFWRGGYVNIKDILPFWWVLFILIMFLAIYGFVSKFRDTNQRLIVLSFGIIGVISFILAVGAASEFTKPLFTLFWNHLPFFSGFRDSQKFVALLCLCYAYLGVLGINEFSKAITKYWGKLQTIGMSVIIVAALVLPLAYSFIMFDFHGQLGVTDYPTTWEEINDYLNQDKSDFNVLFLPWHQYMEFSWLPNQQQTLRNPSEWFFDKPIISGDNIEMPGIYSESTNPISNYVEFLLSNSNEINNLGELLAPLNVKYIILVNDADYQNYDFLNHQKDLTVALAEPGITLFLNQYPTARAYATDSIVHIQTLEDYLVLSQTQDVLDHIYVLGSGQDTGSTAKLEEIGTSESNPVTYEIGGTSQKYIIFTIPQDVSTYSWEYNGQQPLMTNLGFMPVFKSSPNGGKIIYTNFYRFYLPGYIISSMTIIAIIILHISKQK